MPTTSNRTIASYNVVITLDKGLARKYARATTSSMADFRRLLEDGATGLPNTVVMNNRDESFLGLDHRVAYGDTGPIDDRSLSLSIDVLEPELQFLRTLMDTALSKRLSEMIEVRKSRIEAEGRKAAADRDEIDPTVLTKDLLSEKQDEFPKVYIMYGLGSDLGHWAGPFETVLIDINYHNDMEGLEKTTYTFVANPGVSIPTKIDVDETSERYDFVVRVPILKFDYESLAPLGVDGVTPRPPSGFFDSAGDQYRARWNVAENRVYDFHRNITELISLYFTAIGMPNHLLVLPDFDAMLATFIDNKKIAIHNRVWGARGVLPAPGSAHGPSMRPDQNLDLLIEDAERSRGYGKSIPLAGDTEGDPAQGHQFAMMALIFAKEIYAELGLKLVHMGVETRTGTVIDAPKINQEQFLALSTLLKGKGLGGYPWKDRLFPGGASKDEDDLRVANWHNVDQYLVLDMEEHMAEVSGGDYLAPIRKIMAAISSRTDATLMIPFQYWESNLMLAEVYKNMIGTTPSLYRGDAVSTAAGLFVYGDRTYIKNYLQAGIVTPDKDENLASQEKFITGSLPLIPLDMPTSPRPLTHPVYDPPGSTLKSAAWALERYRGKGDPFWQRLADLNTPALGLFRPALEPYYAEGLPFFQYVLGFINRKFQNTSFFDRDLAINKIPDEFNYSLESRQQIANFGMPIFRCNTSNPNVLSLNIKTDEAFYPLFGMSFGDLQWVLAEQTASIPHDYIKKTDATITEKDVLAMFVKILEDYSNSDAVWVKARRDLLNAPGAPNASVPALAKNLAALLTTSTGLGISKVHKKYSKSSAMSFLYFFFQLFQFRFSGRIKTLPMFEYSDGAILSRPSLLFVNRLNHVRGLYNSATNLNTTNNFYSGLYRIFGFKHVISSRDAFSEFLIIKDPLDQGEDTGTTAAATSTGTVMSSPAAAVGGGALAVAATGPVGAGGLAMTVGTGGSMGSGGGGSTGSPWHTTTTSSRMAPLRSDSPSPGSGPLKDTGSSKSVLDPDHGGYSHIGSLASGRMTPIVLKLDVWKWVDDNTNWNTPDIGEIEVLVNAAQDYLNTGYKNNSFIGIAPGSTPTESEALEAYWRSVGVYDYSNSPRLNGPTQIYL